MSRVRDGGYAPIRTSNLAELEYLSRLRPGTQPVARGWPDFLIFPAGGGAPYVCEVKPGIFRGGDVERLKYEQTAILVALQTAGLDCRVSDGVTERQFDLSAHGSLRWQEERGRTL